MQESIDTLMFRDLYLSSDETVEPRYNPIRNDRNKHLPRNAPVEEPWIPVIKDLYRKAERIDQSRSDFAIQLENMRVRAIRTKSFDDFTEYCFRRLPGQIPKLEDLNYSEQFLDEIFSWGTREGLILIMGPTGSGKTTLIMSLLDFWLDDLGGVTLTIEDPVEFKLRKTGHNFKTIQREAKTVEDWPRMVSDCLRYAPDTVLCGEIRTPETAGAVLNLANSGHRVIASVHGGSIAAGTGRLLQLASSSNLGAGAADALAECFISAAWQKIENGKPNVQWLPTKRDGSTDESREYIRQGNLKMLAGIIDRQKNERDSNAKRPAPSPFSNGRR